MDLKHFVGFIYGHYVVILGTTLALFFTTCMILLIRSIGNKSEKQDGGAVDLKAIEGAMKRVLQSQPVSVIAGAVAAAPVDGQEVIIETPADGEGGGGGGGGATSEELADRDAKIAELQKDLENARNALNAADGEDPAKQAMKEEIQGLTSKLEGLQARLAEYEIIEDDIADLSMFKEENARLKQEIEKIKSGAPIATATPASAPDAAAAVAAAPAAESAPVAPAEAPSAEASATPVPAPAPAVASPDASAAPAAAGGFELNLDDDAVKQFAAAAGGTEDAAASPAPASAAEDLAALDSVLQEAGATEVAEDPLAGLPDPDKLLSEVEKIPESNANDGDALDDSLDTDKLLAEVDTLKKTGTR